MSAAVVASRKSLGCLRTASRTASICSSARLTAAGPVTSPVIQIEKNNASSPPSRMRGMSRLPVLLRAPMSKVLLVNQPLRHIVVRVDDDRAIVNLARAGRDPGILIDGDEHRHEDDRGQEREVHQSGFHTGHLNPEIR
jgi:hypothetical protein